MVLKVSATASGGTGRTSHAGTGFTPLVVDDFESTSGRAIPLRLFSQELAQFGLEDLAVIVLR